MSDGPEGPSLEAFLLKVQRRVQRIFSEYRIPPADAEALLEQSLLAFVYQWESIPEHQQEEWFLITVLKQCRLYRRDRPA